MARRWLMYLAALAGCIVFYCAYREWISWLVLMGALALPWFSLLTSLPAMLAARLRLTCPAEAEQDTPVAVGLRCQSPLPVPMVRWQLHIHHAATGSKTRLGQKRSPDTAHCGVYRMLPRRVRIYDWLGLFGFPKACTPASLAVLPRRVAIEPPPSLEKCRPRRWKPKPGGGFSENHDLRPYVPGDDLRQIHWKLAAKTGNLIIREPIQPVRGRYVLLLTLHGTPAQLDDTLGRLRWMMDDLLRAGVPHEVRCLTGEGLLCLPVADADQAHGALLRLLDAPTTQGQSLGAADADWQYRIGGGGHEA